MNLNLWNTFRTLHKSLSYPSPSYTEEGRREMETTPYFNKVGSIMYEMVCSRSNLTHVISVVRRFMGNPRHAHWEDLKWVLRFLNGTISSVQCIDGLPMTKLYKGVNRCWLCKEC